MKHPKFSKSQIRDFYRHCKAAFFRRGNLPPVFLAITLFMVYLQTMAPALTWANYGSDGGDLITAVAIGGIAHPTGYPTYLLLARTFQLLPIGNLAYRTNLMSAVALTLAAVFVYALVVRSLPRFKITPNWIPGLIAAFTFGLTPVAWSQAVITEVYTLQALFVALILYLVTYSPQSTNAQKRLDRLRGGIMGLALGNHITVVFIIPLGLLVAALEKSSPPDTTSKPGKNVTSHAPPPNSTSFRRSTVFPSLWGRLGGGAYRLNWTSLRRQITWLAIGMLIYLTLPLRAMTDPAVNWGNPATLKGFWWLVSGHLYQTPYLRTPAGFWNRIYAIASLFLEQFGIVGLILGLTGLIVYSKPSRLYALTTWVAVTASIFAMRYKTDDSYLYLIPAFMSFSIWIGLGVGNLMDEFSRRARAFSVGIVILSVASIVILTFSHWAEVDASHDQRAENFGQLVLETAPADAIIFAQRDYAIFTMWYFHFALEKRPDLIVLASELLKFDWYQETMRSKYPSLVLADGFPWPERIQHDNPHRPVCYVEFDGATQIFCEQPDE